MTMETTKTSLTENEGNTLFDNSEKVYSKDFSWYAGIFGWPAAILVVLQILFEVIIRRQYPLFPAEQTWEVSILLIVCYLTFITILAIKKYQAKQEQVLIANVTGGLITSLAIAIFQLFWHGRLWTIFNLIALPLLSIALGLVLGYMIYKIYKLIK